MARSRAVIIAVTSFLQAWAFGQSPPGPAIPLEEVNLDETTLRVHFIDIGPGLAMLIETPAPNSLHVFVDGGKWGLDGLMDYVTTFVPTSESIDAAIVTHADLDHYRGMLRIFDAYQVNEFWYTGYESEELDESSTWSMLLARIEAEESCVQYVPLEDWVAAGDIERLDDLGTPDDPGDDIVIQYLNVDSDPPELDPISGRRFDESQRRNNASLVIKLTYGEVSFLITGDINGRDKSHTDPATDDEIDSEELELWTRHQLSQEFSLAATVLQLPHHGSNGSGSSRFIQAVDPAWVVIPAGHQYNHPAPETLRRIDAAGVPASHVLRTDEGDSTPETRPDKDPRGDDSLIFETDGRRIARILRVTAR